MVVGVVALTFAVAMACGESSSKPGSGSAAGAGGDADSTSAGAPAGGSRADGGAVSGGVAGSVAGKGGDAEPTAGDGGASALGGAGGGSSGGAGEGGSGGVAEPDPSGGAAGAEAGAGGAVPIATSCEAASPTVKPSCGPQNDPDGGNACRECLKSECCVAWQACYGTGPRNACGYGEQVGDAIGEADCTLLCWYQTYDGSKSDAETIEACAEQCAACADTLISEVTNELISCAYDECADDCFPTDF